MIISTIVIKSLGNNLTVYYCLGFSVSYKCGIYACVFGANFWETNLHLCCVSISGSDDESCIQGGGGFEAEDAEGGWFFGENIVNSVWRKTGQNFCLWRKVANIIRVVYEEEGGSRLRMQKVGWWVEGLNFVFR